MSNKKGSIISLLPLFIFVALFIGTGLFAGDFNAMPITVAALIASVAGFFLYFKEPFKDKLSAYLNEEYFILLQRKKYFQLQLEQQLHLACRALRSWKFRFAY